MYDSNGNLQRKPTLEPVRLDTARHEGHVVPPVTRRVLIAAVVAAVAKGCVLLWLIPPFQTPDEYGHYDYVLYLANVNPWHFVRGDGLHGLAIRPVTFTTRELPCLADATGTARHMWDATRVRRTPFSDQLSKARACRGLDREDTLMSQRCGNPLFSYPPLYYFGASLEHRALSLAGVNPLLIFHAIRFTSLLLLVAVLIVAYRLLAVLRAGDGVASVVVWYLALQPQLSMLSVSVQPDMLGLLLTTSCLLWLVRLAHEPSARTAGALGLVLGLLLLTKLHLALPIAVTGLVTLALGLVWPGRPGVTWLRAGVVALAVATGTGGWWYGRSLILFGNAAGLMSTTPLPFTAPSLLDNLRYFVDTRLVLTFRSYWGVWGWLDYGLDDAAVPWLIVVSWLPAIVGLLALVAWRSEQKARTQLDRRAIADAGLIALAMALFVAEMIYITAKLGPANDQGRHWLPFGVVHALYFAIVAAALRDASWHRIATMAGRTRVWWRRGALVSAAVALAGTLSWVAIDLPVGYVEIDMLSSVDSRLDVFFDFRGAGATIDPLEVATVEVRKRDGLVTRRLPVGGRTLYGMRVDPIASPGSVLIAAVRLVDRDGRLVRALPLTSLEPVHDIARASLNADGLRIETTRSGIDPILDAHLESPAVFPAGVALGALKRTRPVVRRLFHVAPLLAWVSPAMPSFLALAVLCAALAHEAARAADRRVSAACLRACWQWGFTGLLVGLNTWLMIKTWFYYRA